MAYITETNIFAPSFPKFAALKTLQNWVSIHVSAMRERRALAGLTTAQLEDIGVSAKQANSESKRPFWSLSNAR
ncbi:MAG: DUF1127 domain-containing protein [Pikeienuella sp.]